MRLAMTDPDYSRLIDAPTWAFIEKTAAFYPADAVQRSTVEQRAVYDAMCAAFRAPRPPGLDVTDRAIAGVPCRVYARVAPAQVPGTLVYFHGGGFVVGGLDSHDDVCAELCAATGLRVVSADYRLAPEHRHPASFDDARAVLGAARIEFGAPLVVAGDSAGGNLAAGCAQALRGSGASLAGLLMIYPGLGGPRDLGSAVLHANAPMLTGADVAYYDQIRRAPDHDEGDPTFLPLRDSRFDGLPPTVVISAECDPLCDDGALYCDRVRAAGGQALWIREPGLVHGYLRARRSVPRAQASFERIIAAARALAQGRLPDLEGDST